MGEKAENIINIDDIKTIKEDILKREKFQENMASTINMINIHHNEVVREEREARKVQVKSTAKKKLKIAFYIAIGITLSALGHRASENIQGKYAVIQEFRNIVEENGIDDYGKAEDYYIDNDKRINRMIELARKSGMTESEIAIGLTDYTNFATANKIMGKAYPNYSEKRKIYQKAYHKMKSQN